MRAVLSAVFLVSAALASIAPETARAELTKRDFCKAVEYCHIPAKFRSGPFLAPPLIREVTLREIQKHCSASGHAAVPFGMTAALIGCARIQGGNCIVYVPTEVKEISSTMADMILQHELAHCRGWTHDR